MKKKTEIKLTSTMKMKINIYFFLKDATYPGVNDNIRRQISSLVVYHLFFFTDVVTNRLTYPLTLILLICEVSIT